MGPPIDARRRKSIERIAPEFLDLIKGALEPSLFESINPMGAENRLLQAETNLAAAEGCVNAMRRTWPDGEDIYDRFLLAISELSLRRGYVEDFISLFSLEITDSELNKRYQAIMAKNRESLMIAGTYIAEAIDVLYEMTGIALKFE